MKSRRNRPALVAAGISLVLSLIASFYLALSPCFVRGTRGSGTVGGPGVPSSTRIETTICESLLQSQGLGVLIPLGIPIFFGLVGLMAAAWKLRVTLGLVALLFQLFWLITGFSIGLFYIPAAMAMIVAAVLNAIPDSGRTASASEASLTGAEDLDDFVKRPEPPVE